MFVCDGFDAVASYVPPIAMASSIDQKDIANILAQELFYQQFITLEGLNSGVPTRTTPTLTPTTLRNIEQTFIELQSKPESHENEAGFVPPLVHSIGNNQYIQASEVDVYSKSSWHNPVTHLNFDSDSSRPTPPVTPVSGATAEHHPRRNMGGRKPAKDLNLSPEEEERRKVRRERNKMAAARCRKRRVDHTNALMMETDCLEQKKQGLQNELQELQSMKEELEFLLDSHRSSHLCRLENGRTSPLDIKPFVLPPCEKSSSNDNERVKAQYLINNDKDMFSIPPPSKKIMLNPAAPTLKPSRPSTLNVNGTAATVLKTIATSAADLGIPINTPSAGIQFNFDSLMVGGTGLTPVSGPLVPSCSTQQRNLPTTINGADISSPDNCGPPKLVSL